ADLARALPAVGARARSRERGRPERALAPRRLDPPTEDRGEAGAARAGERLRAPPRRPPHPQARARGGRARHEDPVAGPVGAREGPARVLPAPAAEGDPGGARLGRRPAGGDERPAGAG